MNIKKFLIILLILFVVSLTLNLIQIRYTTKNICYINYVLRLMKYDMLHQEYEAKYDNIIAYKYYEIPPDIMYYLKDSIIELYELNPNEWYGN